jgi:tripeptidyl-peptidase II
MAQALDFSVAISPAISSDHTRLLSVGSRLVLRRLLRYRCPTPPQTVPAPKLNSPVKPFAILLVLLLAAVRSVAALPTAETFAVEIETHIPKREMGVLEFLRQYPEFDGRGVTIAIFDTGVDPGAAGLQLTSTGERKIVDVIDGSGSGDVDTSKKAKLSADGTLKGLTGRTLTLPAGVVNPTGDFHLGWMRGEQVLGRPALARSKEERTRRWQQSQQNEQAERLRQRQIDEAAGRRPAKTKPEADLTRAERDLLAREAILDELEKGFLDEDPGSVHDCVVWHDGEHWNVLVDTDEDGDLGNEQRLRPFAVAGEYANFGERIGCNFAVQVYDQGNLLSIVTVDGSHGTHVAAIAASHFPEDPSRNGIAPGAKILSVRISKGYSDGWAINRAIAACVRHGAKVSNTSFGGVSLFQDGQGYWSELFTKMVDDYGVLAFVSVGNNGPALSTLGHPGGENPAVIGVGAYVSSDMSRALYATLGETRETAFHFSSRGPAKNGSLGVDIIGPGAALASVAFEDLSRSQMYNGTSMSSPAVAGVGALLVSAAEQLGLEASPNRIRSALVNSARLIPELDVWAQGPGLAQVGPAFEHLRQHQKTSALDVRIQARTTDNPMMPGPGLYFRDPTAQRVWEPRITLETVFPGGASLEQKATFSEDLALVSTTDWVTVPGYLALTNGETSFRARIVLPTASSAGPQPPLFAEILGYLIGQAHLGPVVRIPITVMQPMALNESPAGLHSFQTTLSAGDTARRYYAAPGGATHLRLRLRREAQDDAPRAYLIHAVTLEAAEAFTRRELKRNMRLAPGAVEEMLIPVIAGRTTEVVFHQMWSSLGNSRLYAEAEFIGLSARQDLLTFVPNQNHADVNLVSPLVNLSLQTSARLTEAVYIHVPTEATIIPLGDRDLMPPTPLENGPTNGFGVRQKFEFTLDQPLTARAMLDSNRYLSRTTAGGSVEFYHESGRFIGAASWNSPVKLPKGKITAISRIRTVDSKHLEQLRDTPLMLIRKLDTPTTLPIYLNSGSVLQGTASTRLALPAGRDTALLIGDSARRALKDFKPEPAFFRGEFKVENSGEALLTLPIEYRRGIVPEFDKRPASKPKELERSPEERLKDELFEARLKAAVALRFKDKPAEVRFRETVLQELREERKEEARPAFELAYSMAARAGWISDWRRGGTAAKPAEAKDKGAEPSDATAETGEAAKEESQEPTPSDPAAKTEGTEPELEKPTVEAIFALLDEAKAILQPEEVAAYFGLPPPEPNPGDDRREYDATRKRMGERRELLRDIALLRCDVQIKQEAWTAARAAYAEASAWSPAGGKPVKEQEAALLAAEGHLGLALRLLNETLAEDPFNRRLRERRAKLYSTLGWETFAGREQLLLDLDKNTRPRSRE